MGLTVAQTAASLLIYPYPINSVVTCLLSPCQNCNSSTSNAITETVSFPVTVLVVAGGGGGGGNGGGGGGGGE